MSAYSRLVTSITEVPVTVTSSSRSDGNVARVEQPGERHPAPGSLRLVQDLVNTVDLEGGADELRDADALTAWARENGVAGAPFDAGDLAEVLVLREALRDVCQA